MGVRCSSGIAVGSLIPRSGSKKPRYEISGVRDADGKFVEDKHDGINTRAFRMDAYVVAVNMGTSL